ncbi:hypothetical protein B0H16DRAFT_1301759 [Mycena metata]|uniref:RING-type E3 ubiquitin transferase n=1 Tax=Mycena metata TaxID=1033252 RepID=A0AAD7K7F2_9AGAR|nr:hypothetical protein B0H16DRAFT_1301759 [Mycena metata]
MDAVPDTCRICSAPAEVEQPLFYPCKCSGTIRYIHQDCLTTWLAHSKKKTCDVCKHPYSFTKVYATDMPTRLPPVLLLRRVAQQSFFAMLFAVRAVAVAIIWLAVLPWITVMSWRAYFAVGDSTQVSFAWWISDRPRPADAPEENAFYMVFHSDATAVPAPDTFIARVATHPLWLSLSSDIFTGQIIASLVVLTFVAVFLLREWISQNARPGVFEDEEVEPLPPLVPLPAPPQPRLLEVPQLLDVPPALPAPPRNVNDRMLLARRQMQAVREMDAVDTDPTLKIPNRKRRLSQKGKEREQDDATQSTPDLATGSRVPAVVSRRRVRKADTDRFHEQLRRAHLARDHAQEILIPDQSAPDNGDKFEFTFRSTTSFPQGDFNSRRSKESKRRRPQLPNTTPTLLDGPTAVVALSPLSPNLATYRAPEELEAEASGYFDREEAAQSSQGGEHQRYFADAEGEEEDEGEREDGPPPLQPVSDSEDDDDDDYDDVGSPRNEFNEDGDFDMEDEEGADEDEEGEDAIQIEDDEVAEVADGEEQEHVFDVVAPAPAGGADAGAIDLNDDMDGNVEDDMEGAMEAIGMRGPVYGVVQNAALMIFVLDTAIGLLVCIPFTLGKATALLSLDPHRFLQILHLPIRAMRIVTDPVVDSVVYIIAALLLPFVGRLLYRVANLLFLGVLFLISMVFGKHKADKTFEMTSSVVSIYFSSTVVLSDKPLEQLFAWSSLSSSSAPTPSKVSTPSAFQTTVVNAAEPYFAALGKEVRLSTEQLRTGWTQLALGHGPKEKVFAVTLGYVVVMILVSLYLNLLTVGNMKTAGRAVRTAVREQLLVLKVATFIFIELVTFPLGCGIVLDICTVWLFPEASLISRLAFFRQAPLTAMFYHWVAGTMFMYSFAVLLAGCRTLLRKGAMWFIKDPQAQDSHPIRDILDRPTLTQLHKICVSGVMYSFVVACVVGSVAGLLFLGSKSILPFRWKNRSPLSNVPIDLIFLHLVLPYTTHYFKPRTGIKRVSKSLWKFLASRLRLSSYFFGGRFPKEEYSSKHWTFMLLRFDDDIENVVKDGSFRRVPASDNISLPRDMRATAAVTEHGEPIDDEAREFIAMQNEEAVKAKRRVEEDYMVVYIPPYFQYRVFLFIAILWVMGAMFLGIVFALPIQLGRSFFALFVPRAVHDGYSFIAGSYLLWGCYLFGRAVDRLDKRRQRRGGDEQRADLRLLVFKRGLLWTAKITYMTLFLGILIPTLISLVVDLYIILPIRLSLDPTLVPRIRIVDSWAMGLLYTKIMLHINRTQPPNPITRGVQHITTNGWTHPEPITATKEVIGPLTFGLLGMILLPGGVFLLAQHFIPLIPRNSNLLFMEVYPAIFVAVAGVRFGAVLLEMLGTWSQSIRDKEFLVEMRLRNLEPDSPKSLEPDSSKSKVD